MSGRYLPLQQFESVLRAAVAEGATDVHFEPRDRHLQIRLRIDGRMVAKGEIAEAQRESFLQAAKIAGRMDIAERRLPQDGRGVLAGARPCSLRFSCLPGVNGESLVVRLLADESSIRPWHEMDLSGIVRTSLERLLAAPHGMIYVTGPTGSGKTTLLHALLADLPGRQLDSVKIITLEEPVELRNPRCFLQIEVDDRIGRGFAELLRSVLRHDPDILLVGETRDRPTADITLRAALSGRLCLSTLHTNTALGAVPRLIEMGLDPLVLGAALQGVVAQRLVRRPCPACVRPHPHAEEWRRYLPEDEIEPPEFLAAELGRPCARCGGRGYKGRIALLEVVPLFGLEAAVAHRAPIGDLERAAREAGYPSLFDDGLRLAARGLTTVEEVCAVAERPLLLSRPMTSTSHPPKLSLPRGAHAAAFTLIEMLAVLAVIAAIIAIGVPAVARVLQNSRVRNAEGTAAVVRAGLVQFLSKPGSMGTYPVTEGTAPVLATEYTGTGTPTATQVAQAATLDNVLLSEGILDRPLSLRMGVQNASLTGTANGFEWAPTTASFTGTAAPSINFSAVSRAECAISDGTSNPGITGQTAGSAACAFNLGANGTLIPSGTRVAYLVIKSVPDSDAYQLALDVDGIAQVQNTAAAPAALDQSAGAVAYAKDSGGTGFVDVYYYLSSI
jgi:prepilin-type N-terminal cleavage/methylation domain-containing protein